MEGASKSWKIETFEYILYMYSYEFQSTILFSQAQLQNPKCWGTIKKIKIRAGKQVPTKQDLANLF